MTLTVGSHHLHLRGQRADVSQQGRPRVLPKPRELAKVLVLVLTCNRTEGDEDCGTAIAN